MARGAAERVGGRNSGTQEEARLTMKSRGGPLASLIDETHSTLYDCPNYPRVALSILSFLSAQNGEKPGKESERVSSTRENIENAENRNAALRDDDGDDDGDDDLGLAFAERARESEI